MIDNTSSDSTAVAFGHLLAILIISVIGIYFGVIYQEIDTIVIGIFGILIVLVVLVLIVYEKKEAHKDIKRE